MFIGIREEQIAEIEDTRKSTRVGNEGETGNVHAAFQSWSPLGNTVFRSYWEFNNTDLYSGSRD